MLDNRNKIREEEKAVLVGVIQKDQKEQEAKEYLDELHFLG